MGIDLDTIEIYRAFPRKKDRRFALTSIQRAITRLENGESGKRMFYDDAILYLLEAVRDFAASPAGQRGVYTPYCATFMNRSSYLDDRREWQHLKREEEQALQRNALANVGVYRP